MILGRLVSALGRQTPKRLHKNHEAARRWKMSAMVEPPLDCKVLERPCTVVLMEDQDIYGNSTNSWKDSFLSAIPQAYGMSFASVSFSESSSFDERLDELKAELPPIIDAVLVARGPISSWCAQFYLESFPLQGLIMVDPILLNNKMDDGAQIELVQRIQERMNENNQENESGVTAGSWTQRLLDTAQSKALKLEPNAVPMLVIQTSDDPKESFAAVEVARRHSNDNVPFGEVPVKKIQQREEIMKEIDDWIDSIL